MNKTCLRLTRNGVWLVLGVAGLCAHASTAKVTIGDGEQNLGPVWDQGTLTLTVNGHAETVSYGQLSTVKSVASDLATLFTLDCQSPVTATAQENVITLTTRLSVAIAPATGLSVWDTTHFQLPSFYLMGNSSGGGQTPSPSLSCTPNPVPAGGTVMCSAEFPQGVTGTVSFTIDGGAWSTGNVNAGGWAESASRSGLAAGSHTVEASYPGDSNYAPTTQTLTLTVDSGVLTSQAVYSYGLTYLANNNIATANDLVNGQWSGLQYDTLNRLVGGTLTPATGTGPRNWCWSYDGFGNRMQEADSASAFGANCSATGSVNSSPAAYTTANRTSGVLTSMMRQAMWCPTGRTRIATMATAACVRWRHG
jgi:Bacterial Ig-like domain (group 3)